WRSLWDAGREHGLVAGGYRAIDALRLEKGYRVWSSDITPEETPYEAGLGFAVKLEKGVDFIGREALIAAKSAGPRKRLRCLVLGDPRSVALGNEPVRVDGRIVGRVTSGGFGFAVERSIAFAYLPPDQAAIGTHGDVEVFGEWIGFEIVRERLAAQFPGHGVVGEEYGTDAGDASVRWYVDPIDGTHNFIRGIPIFGTLLAAERDGELQASVISAPAVGQRWYGWRGGGAWTTSALDGGAARRISVSRIASIADAQVLFASAGEVERSGLVPGFPALLEKVWRERAFGDFWGYTL